MNLKWTFGIIYILIIGLFILSTQIGIHPMTIIAFIGILGLLFDVHKNIKQMLKEKNKKSVIEFSKKDLLEKK